MHRVWQLTHQLREKESLQADFAQPMVTAAAPTTTKPRKKAKEAKQQVVEKCLSVWMKQDDPLQNRSTIQEKTGGANKQTDGSTLNNSIDILLQFFTD